MNAVKWWHHLFLEERPSIGLSFFRIFVALTVGLHVIPSFFHLDDNYLSTAFKSVNFNFFTRDVLLLVQKSPDWVVIIVVWLFVITWFAFLVGYRAQLSCIAMTLCCYYFYALNTFQIGTLSWDILLVTLFLMCVTPYHGDYFSVDALRKRDTNAWQRLRPFFLQRLLQIQIALTYFYTALYKISPEGNWITGNPMHTLMNYPTIGVTKNFLLKEWLAARPEICYASGLLIVSIEILMPFLLFNRATRRAGIILGCIFHTLLILTFDVPAIFFFLFPAQLLLFIDPKKIVAWITVQRMRQHRLTVLYDGGCGFCQAAVHQLKIMDLWGKLTFEPRQENLSELKLLDGDKVYGGFDAFRHMCWLLPMLYPFLFVVYLPGATWIGRMAYRLIAKNRLLLHRSDTCSNNQCFRPKAP